MTNVLSFDVRRKGDKGPAVITPCIDGVMLTSLAEHFEKSHGMTDPAGGYGGLISEFFRYGSLDRYFLGESETPLFQATPGRIFVLGCECGEVGCWPLTALVRTRGREVSWHAFEQPHRKARDYSAFGPFLFDRDQYESALKSLPS
jgi:hypothetical protein